VARTFEQAPSAAAPGERLHAAESPHHLPIAGVPIFDGSLRDALGVLLSSIREGVGARVATANLDFFALARGDRHLRSLLLASHLVVADGAPIAWLARLSGARSTGRVSGVDLVDALLRASTELPVPLKVAIYGSEPDIASAARDTFAHRFPRVEVVSQHTPPFRPLTAEELRQNLDELVAADPHVVLVALGCPKQEHFIATHSAALPRAVWIGVGGTLDFFAGRRRRAPQLFQQAGLEWAVRLVQEPRRLWRRYLLRDLPTFMAIAPGCISSGVRVRLARWRGRGDQ